MRLMYGSASRRRLLRTRRAESLIHLVLELAATPDRTRGRRANSDRAECSAPSRACRVRAVQREIGDAERILNLQRHVRALRQSDLLRVELDLQSPPSPSTAPDSFRATTSVFICRVRQSRADGVPFASSERIDVRDAVSAVRDGSKMNARSFDAAVAVDVAGDHRRVPLSRQHPNRRGDIDDVEDRKVAPQDVDRLTALLQVRFPHCSSNGLPTVLVNPVRTFRAHRGACTSAPT